MVLPRKYWHNSCQSEYSILFLATETLPYDNKNTKLDENSERMKDSLRLHNFFSSSFCRVLLTFYLLFRVGSSHVFNLFFCV